MSVSLSDDDVAVLDAYVKSMGLPSRSAGVKRAIRMLRFPALEQDYEDAWTEWLEDGDARTWDEVTSDGLSDASR